MRGSPVVFVPKRQTGTPAPWAYFGSTQAEYERWVPHICGVCCLKMAGDTFGKTTELSLYDLTKMCVEFGGFRIDPRGEIKGVYHHPLAEVAKGLGMPTTVMPEITPDIARSTVENLGLVILSVDLAKLGTGLQGSHLLLIHDYAADSDSFVLHDCSSVVRSPGENVAITRNELVKISNSRGLIVHEHGLGVNR